MADIGRLAGPLLEADLDRQGKDLQFSTNASPLLYLDFQNFKAAINANAATLAETFTVVGNVALANLLINGDTISSTTGNIHLGIVDVVKIDGGALNYVMTTDGSGNLSWKNISTISSNLTLSSDNITLGVPIDGSLVVNSAYRYWHGNTTTVTDAIDNLNQVMLNVYQNTYVGAVNITANVVNGSSPLTVQFNASVLGNPTNFEWVFTDQSNVIIGTSTLHNPAQTFSSLSGGTYSVYFKASNINGTLAGSGNYGDPHLAQGSYADEYLANYITVFPPIPVALFSLNNLSIDSGTSVALSNLSVNASSYVIHWGDGTTTPIASNLIAGGANQPPVTHSYTNVAGDTDYTITLEAYSPDAVPGGITVTSAPVQLHCFSVHSPSFTVDPIPTIGNNQHATTPNGFIVTFTNTTSTGPGISSLFPGNKYVYNWGDGTTTDVLIGSGLPGDVGHTITHAYTLVDPTVEQIFNATLSVVNGNTASPFVSPPTGIVVTPAPTSLYLGEALLASDRIGDTPQTGYMYVDIDGVNRATFMFNNLSINADTYKWAFGDGNQTGTLIEGVPGTPTGGSLQYVYPMAGTFTTSLLAHGPSSLSLVDDTLTKNNYIDIWNPPTPPSSFPQKTLTIQSVGSSPLLAANAINNSASNMPLAGVAVNRVTVADPIASDVISNAYSDTAGYVFSMVNGVEDGTSAMFGINDIGFVNSLDITEDKDAHTFDSLTYPSRFYALFSGRVIMDNVAVSTGYNTYQLGHSTIGSTNELGFVKDNLLAVPELISMETSMRTVNAGTLRYVSGVPYFNTDGVIAINGVGVSRWIGQTYLDSNSPLEILPGPILEGTGPAVILQGRSYAELNTGADYMIGGIPVAGTGLGGYTFGDINIAINGSAASASKVKMQLSNVNGTSVQVELEKPINTFNIAITGVDELNIPVLNHWDNSPSEQGKRILVGNGSSPAFSTATDYYTDFAFEGAVVVEATTEAVVRFGVLAHDETDYSGYLPQGPVLSFRPDTQYFTFAFRKPIVSNFTVNYTGKISGLYVAAPGTVIDSASSMNGWVDGTQVYAGAGVPGDIVAYGNGSLGCAKTAGDIIPIGVPVTNGSYVMTLGSENSSNATSNQIFVCIALNAGDSLSSIYIVG
jgi:PKD repeat protein